MTDGPESHHDRPLAATTTAEENRQTAGQRHINSIWEGTQSAIAVAVTVAMIYAALMGKESKPLENAFTLIIAIYFVRTNHTRTGGVKAGDQGR